jgi:hypothetical protein
MDTMTQRTDGLTVTVGDRSAAWHPRVDDAVRVVIRHGQACPECPHFDGESGRTGRVVRVCAPTGAPSHPYLVVLERQPAAIALVDRHLAIFARHYAANELEPLVSTRA